MEDQEEKQTVQAVKSRPGTFGLATKLNSQPKDDSIKKDEEDEGQKKTTSKSTLEKLLLEEEKRQQTLARESTGSVIYDYDEPVTIPYSVQVHESESAQSTDTGISSNNDVGVDESEYAQSTDTGISSKNDFGGEETDTGNISNNDVGGEESQVQEDTIEVTGDTTEVQENTIEVTGDTNEGVPEQISDEGNQFSYTSESYTLEVSNEEVEYDEQGDQLEAISSTMDDEKLFTNSKLSETRNSLEILQISVANSESTANEDQENSECSDDGQDNVPRKKVGNFFRKLFGGKKKSSE